MDTGKINAVLEVFLSMFLRCERLDVDDLFANVQLVNHNKEQHPAASLSYNKGPYCISAFVYIFNFCDQ